MINQQNQRLVSQLVNAYQQKQYSQIVYFIEANSILLTQDPAAAHIYAGALRKLGYAERALTCLKKSLKRFKNHPELLNSLGNVQIELQKYSDAVMTLRKAESAAPNSLDVQYNLCRALKENKQLETANKKLEKLVALSPDNVNAMLLLADISSKLGKVERTELWLNNVLRKQPNNLAALNNLGNVYRARNKLDRAIQLLEQAKSIQSSNPTLLRNLAACYALNDNVEQAKLTYQSALKANPLDWSTQEELASLLWSMGDDNPFCFIEKHLGDVTQNTAFWLAFIRLLLRVDKFEEALQYLNKVECALPNLVDMQILKARVLRELCRVEEALGYSEKARKAEKYNEGALSESGYSLLSLNKPNEALSMFENLRKMSPENQGWWTLLSTCWYMKGEFQRYSWLCDYTNLVAVLPVKSDETDRSMLNEKVKTCLLGMHKTQRHPIGQSLRNGTQTYEDLFNNSSPVIQELGSAILTNAIQLIKKQKVDKTHPFLSRLSTDIDFIGSWSVRLRSGGYHQSHFHPEGWLSGVYYVDVPNAVNADGEGWLVFGRAEIPGQIFSGDFAVKPQVGHMVLFPSYMWHGTNTFASDAQRLTVAFDIIPKKN